LGRPRDDEVRQIARLALPIALAQFGLILIGLVEVAILGRAAAVELAGASIGRSIGFTALALGIGAAAALEPLAAQALGAGEPHVAWRAFRSSLVAAAAITAPCVALALGSTYLLAPLGVAPGIVAPARAFLLASAPGLFFASAFFTGKTFLQTHGRTRAALFGAALANVVNFVACAVLVLGDGALARAGLRPMGLPPLGAFGAGVANTIANAVLAASVVIPALRLKPEAASLASPAPPEADTAGPSSRPAEEGGGPSVTRVLRLGAPIGLQLLAEIGVFSLAAVLAGRLGEVAVSAHQIAIGLASFTFMGVLGISGATAVRVGTAVGERRPPRRAGLSGIAMGAVFMACTSALFLAAPRPLIALFTTDAAVTELGVALLGIAALFQLFDGVQGVAAGALRGAGDVRFAFVANVAGHWLVGFPLALLLAFRLGLGAAGLWWGLLAGLVVVSIALLARFISITRGTIERV